MEIQVRSNPGAPRTGIIKINFSNGIFSEYRVYQAGSLPTCGQVLSATLDWDRNIHHAWDFLGNKGDRVWFSFKGLSGFSPSVSLSSPSGDSFGFGSLDSSQLQLQETGTYTLRIAATLNDKYDLGLLIITGLAARCAAPPIACGETVTGKIQNTVQKDIYRFSGNAGDVVLLPGPVDRMGGGGSSTFFAALTLFDPKDIDLEFEFRRELDFGTPEFGYRLPESGTYTLVISKANNWTSLTRWDDTYELPLRFTKGGCGTPVSCGQTVAGAKNQWNAYKLPGSAGKQIALVLPGENFIQNPFALFDPAGLPYTDKGVGFGNGNFFKLPGDGTYTAFMRSGVDFQLSLACEGVCNAFFLGATSRRFDASGGLGDVSLTTGTSGSDDGCCWTSSSNNPEWLRIISGGGTHCRSWSLAYEVDPNPGPARTGTLKVAGQTFTVTQDGGGGSGCSYSLSPQSQSFGAGGGAASVNVTAPNGCTWTATSNSSWITITSGSGSGNGTVSYAVAANTDPGSRTGTITITGGQTLTITQSGPSNSSPTANAGPDQIVQSGQAVTLSGSGSDPDGDVLTLSWTQMQGPPVTLNGASTPSATFTAPEVTQDTDLVFQLKVNDGKGGTASDDVKITVKKRTCAAFSISPTTAAFSAAGGEGTVQVTGDSQCEWTAAGSAPWITLKSADRGKGNGAVTYTVAPNTGGSPRTGKVTVGGQTVTVTQAGCTYSLSSTTGSFTAAGGTASVGVTTDGSCAWSATARVSWITINSGNPGKGNGTVAYSVAPHTNSASRTGTITIAEQTVTITQSGLSPVKALVAPYTLDTGNPHLKNTFVGVAVANLGQSAGPLSVAGVDAGGVLKGSIQMPSSLAPQGQQAFLTSDIPAPNATTLLVSNAEETFQGFFMVGDNALQRLDGVGGELKEATLLYFPLVRHQDGDTTFLFVYNPYDVANPAVSLKLFDRTGTLITTKTVSLPSGASLTGTIDQVFGANLNVADGYVQVTGSLPVKGFEFYVRAETLSAVTAQAALKTRRLLVPHFFVRNDGGNTELRLLNADTSTITIRIKGFDDKGTLLGTGEFTLDPGKLLIGDVKQLLDLDTSKLGEFEALTGYLDLELFAGFGAFQKTPSVLGTVSFAGNRGKTYSTLPLAAEGTLETLFLHVAQSAQLDVFTGAVIFNPASTTARIRIQAFDENAIKTGEKLSDVPPGRRVVGLLNESIFFGPAFNQVKGHLRISSLPTAEGTPAVPVISFALFGDANQNYLSAIEGQKPVR